jgi:hypothetical protein
MNNFLITGIGMSGSMFLSNVMNKSKQWTVYTNLGAIVTRSPHRNQCTSILNRNTIDLTKKINANKAIKYPTFDSLPLGIKLEYDKYDWAK